MLTSQRTESAAPVPPLFSARPMAQWHHVVPGGGGQPPPCHCHCRRSSLRPGRHSRCACAARCCRCCRHRPGCRESRSPGSHRRARHRQLFPPPCRYSFRRRSQTRTRLPVLVPLPVPVPLPLRAAAPASHGGGTTGRRRNRNAGRGCRGRRCGGGGRWSSWSLSSWWSTRPFLQRPGRRSPSRSPSGSRSAWSLRSVVSDSRPQERSPRTPGHSRRRPEPRHWADCRFPPFPAAPAELGTVVVGVVPSAGAAGLPACAESTDCAMGPAPILNPATIDSAAAATAPDSDEAVATEKHPGCQRSPPAKRGVAGPRESVARMNGT